MCSACPKEDHDSRKNGHIISTSREAYLHKQLPNKALFMGQLTPTAPLGPNGILRLADDLQQMLGTRKTQQIDQR